MEILQVGRHFINVDAVAHVKYTDVADQGKIVQVTMLSTTIVTRNNDPIVKSEVLSFAGEEATTVINYFETLANPL